jgi:hypothetical protein
MIELITISGLGIASFIFEATQEPISNGTFNAVEIISYSLSVVTTTLSTVLIVVRILMVSRMSGTSRRLRIAMEIIVESAVLYLISALVYTLMLSSIPTFAASPTYYAYADILFAYMTVASHPSCLPVLVF